MLKRKFRLKNNSSFKATYSNRRVVSDEFFVLYGGRNKENPENETRIGFVVSKKIHKRAVKRNRIKRLAREGMRLLIKEKSNEKYSSFQSLIFIAKDGVLEDGNIKLDFNKAKASVTKLIDRLANKFI